MTPNFWRAYTDNDRGNKHDVRCGVWREAGDQRKLLQWNHENLSDRVLIRTNYVLPTEPASLLVIEYTIKQEGQVEVQLDLTPGDGLPEIPEIGFILEMADTFDTVSWYGKGPHESYWDRQEGAKLGRYEGKVSDQFVHYLRPQECGNKTGVRAASVTNAHGEGLSIQGLPHLELNVLPYTPKELEAHDHPYQLPKSNKTVLRIQYKQMGVGGDDSWGARVHPEYTLYANRPYSFRFVMDGISKINSNK
ncbi:Beta-galactosidase [compost metagenome]